MPMPRMGPPSDDPFRRGMEDAEWVINGNRVEDKPHYDKSQEAEYAAGQAQMRHMIWVFGG